LNFRNPTWPQVVLLLGCAACVIAAYKLLGEGAAAALAVVTHLLVLFSSPKDPPAPPGVASAPAPGPRRDEIPPPANPWRVLAFAALTGLVACATLGAPDVPALLDGNAAIVRCKQVSAEAGDGGHKAAWRACAAEAGLP
jgi:hypothetical protein